MPPQSLDCRNNPLKVGYMNNQQLMMVLGHQISNELVLVWLQRCIAESRKDAGHV